MTVWGNEAAEERGCAGEYLVLNLFQDRMNLYHINGKDVSAELEKELMELGLSCKVEFKSPCG